MVRACFNEFKSIRIRMIVLVMLLFWFIAKRENAVIIDIKFVDTNIIFVPFLLLSNM